LINEKISRSFQTKNVNIDAASYEYPQFFQNAGHQVQGVADIPQLPAAQLIRLQASAILLF
jgi:hypothetical protein